MLESSKCARLPFRISTRLSGKTEDSTGLSAVNTKPKVSEFFSSATVLEWSVSVRLAEEETGSSAIKTGTNKLGSSVSDPSGVLLFALKTFPGPSKTKLDFFISKVGL